MTTSSGHRTLPKGCTRACPEACRACARETTSTGTRGGAWCTTSSWRSTRCSGSCTSLVCNRRSQSPGGSEYNRTSIGTLGREYLLRFPGRRGCSLGFRAGSAPLLTLSRRMLPYDPGTHAEYIEWYPSRTRVHCVRVVDDLPRHKAATFDTYPTQPDSAFYRVVHELAASVHQLTLGERFSMTAQNIRAVME